MGLIQKKDDEDREYIDGVEIIERSDVPEDLPLPEVEVVEGDSDCEDEEGLEDDPASLSHGCGSGGGEGGTCPLRRSVPVIALVIGVVVAAIAGFFFGRGGFGSHAAAGATLTEGQLDSVVASWSYNGSTKDVTAREAIEAQYSLDVAKNDDGTFNAPSAEVVTAFVRNQILLEEAAHRGIEVNDQQVAEFAQKQLGTSDFAALAAQYGVSEEQAKRIVCENATVNKLYQEIVPANAAAAPQAPQEPADGNADAVSKEYADYIIGLAGEEWDAAKGGWVSGDGPFASALAGSKTFSADGASYTDAQTAYYVAYQSFAQEAQGAQKAWAQFANDLYAKANVSIYGLFI